MDAVVAEVVVAAELVVAVQSAPVRSAARSVGAAAVAHLGELAACAKFPRLTNDRQNLTNRRGGTATAIGFLTVLAPSPQFPSGHYVLRGKFLRIEDEQIRRPGGKFRGLLNEGSGGRHEKMGLEGRRIGPAFSEGDPQRIFAIDMNIVRRTIPQ